MNQNKPPKPPTTTGPEPIEENPTSKKRRNVLRFVDPNFFDLPKPDGELLIRIPISVEDEDESD